MRAERQREILQRIADAGERREGLLAAASGTADAARYVDPERFAIEQRVLFRERAVFFGLSGDLPEPGSWKSARLDGLPVVVVRQASGSLRALVNACSHRGAPLVDSSGAGSNRRSFNCPYHAWTYGLDGTLRSRPAAQAAFDDVSLNCDLRALPVAEKHGLIYVRAEGDEPIDIDAELAGAEDDLAAFELAKYALIDSRQSEWNFNWKCLFDTFTETYHIRTLHRKTLGSMFHPESIFEPFGHNLLLIGVRTDVDDEFDKPEHERTLIPYGTIQYFLPPTGMIVHQLDHLEVWTVEPIEVGKTRLTTAVYAPSTPDTDGSRQYFVKNLELLLHVTETEDFPLVEEIQRNIASGAIERLVHGKIEPALAHFHHHVDQAIESASTG